MPDIRNAKAEFIEEVKGKAVKCAVVQHGSWVKFTAEYLLPCDYTPAEYDVFLQSLDFVYDAGFGGQELFGIIWYTDGTWSSRYEYDGEEEWQHCHVPVVPPELIRAKR
jgi:hypothetical protein